MSKVSPHKKCTECDYDKFGRDLEGVFCLKCGNAINFYIKPEQVVYDPTRIESDPLTRQEEFPVPIKTFKSNSPKKAEVKPSIPLPMKKKVKLKMAKKTASPKPGPSTAATKKAVKKALKKTTKKATAKKTAPKKKEKKGPEEGSPLWYAVNGKTDGVKKLPKEKRGEIINGFLNDLLAANAAHQDNGDYKKMLSDEDIIKKLHKKAPGRNHQALTSYRGYFNRQFGGMGDEYLRAGTDDTLRSKRFWSTPAGKALAEGK